MIKKISGHIMKRKGVYSLVAIVLATGGYFGAQSLQNDTAETRYVVSAVEKGTLITSVSGSGQISASNQLDVKPKTSGDIISVAIKNGQEVKAGNILVQLNATDAYRDVRDAQDSLESAQLSLEKLKAPEDDYSILQAENALTSARNNLEKLKLSQETELQNAEEAKQNAEDSVLESYEDAFGAVTDTFLDLPSVISGLNEVLHDYEISDHEPTVGGRQDNTSALMSTTNVDKRDGLFGFKANAESDYATAREKYDAASESYKNASRYSEPAVIEALLAETVEATEAISEAAKSENSYLGAWVDFRNEYHWEIFSEVENYQKDLATYIGQINGSLSGLLSAERSVKNSLEAVEDAVKNLEEMEQSNPFDLAAAEATIKEREAALENIKEGPDALDLRSQELVVRQRKEALAEVRANLADYTVRAPFDGVITTVDVQKGDSVSSGTTIATIITKERVAEISLNEVDAADVKVGQKATLTFDAVEELSITGEVAEVDALGTVTQGVVTYNTKIIFDTTDERVKPGMSVSASIITDIKQDVILVSSSAIKSSGEISYVEMPSETVAADSVGALGGVPLASLPRQQVVEIGLTDDSETEITSGLSEGDQIITRTISQISSSTSSSSTTSETKSSGLFEMDGGSPPMGR
ncbi:MAG: efflux RND transporter periplasmic adaptor subunit [Patescibacteria group bacterium]|jgi:HlyD family secretion protein